MMSPAENSALATISVQLANIFDKLAKLDGDLEPLVRARAADLKELEVIKRDIAASHDKHRMHFEQFKAVDGRIDRVEQRQRSIAWALFGALLAAETILRGLPPGYLLKLFGGS